MTPRSGVPWVWGARREECGPRRADELVRPGRTPRAMVRAVDVAAPVAVVWRWLGQLAVAPYSYDWIDNLGRRSPRTLTPGCEEIVVGQRMAIVFTVTHVEEHPDGARSWSGVTGPRGQSVAGRTGVTYAVLPGASDARSRLVCRMVTDAPAPVAHALAWGDLVMMRKQLLTLAALAAGTAG
ncbi:hypothetical protein [Nocardioides sp.]|uniref:hypothetical protein n=1 Tax=Nocardioides sp. TaxID=35761 RepID=UPI003518D215